MTEGFGGTGVVGLIENGAGPLVLVRGVEAMTLAVLELLGTEQSE